jgi:AMP phosphorylase
MAQLGEKLRVDIIDIDAGRSIVLLHENDARDMSIHMGDRVTVCKKNSTCGKAAIVDVSDTMVSEGEVGIFNDLAAPMKLSPRSEVYISPREKPQSVSFIRKKIDGSELSKEEINTIITDIVSDSLSDIELSSFVTASAIHGFSKRETVDLTKAMIDTGDKLDFEGMVVDKHCIGGVPGNRTTMIVVPMLASLGFKVPKTSSRAITSPSGTADTMEVLAPVSYGAKDITRFVNKVGACIVWGGAVNLAPADDKIIRVEYPLSIDAEGQVLASIMSKKRSVGSDYVILDIPYGKGSKIADMKKAEKLGEKFVWLGNEIDMKVHVIYTDGTQPIGRGVGPILEAQDVLMTLQGEGSSDLLDKGIMMVGELMNFCGKTSEKESEKLARKSIEDGSADKKMREIIKAQGGNPKIQAKDLSPGKYKRDVVSENGGRVKEINNALIAAIARTAGAPKDKGAGLWINKKVGEKVSAGESLFTIYSESKTKMKYSMKLLEKKPYLVV